jgi:DNA-binding CsgD family transcriptional regulator
VAEAAQMLSITEGTARFYLKSLLSKTDTHRQGQLIALLNSLTPLL